MHQEVRVIGDLADLVVELLVVNSEELDLVEFFVSLLAGLLFLFRDSGLIGISRSLKVTDAIFILISLDSVNLLLEMVSLRLEILIQLRIDVFLRLVTRQQSGLFVGAAARLSLRVEIIQPTHVVVVDVVDVRPLAFFVLVAKSIIIEPFERLVTWSNEHFFQFLIEDVEFRHF